MPWASASTSAPGATASQLRLADRIQGAHAHGRLPQQGDYATYVFQLYDPQGNRVWQTAAADSPAGRERDRFARRSRAGDCSREPILWHFRRLALRGDYRDRPPRLRCQLRNGEFVQKLYSSPSKKCDSFTIPLNGRSRLSCRTDSQPRTHKYHAEATVLTGHLRLPLEQEIKPQAHAKLSEEGGYLSQHRAITARKRDLLPQGLYAGGGTTRPQAGPWLEHAGHIGGRRAECAGGGDRGPRRRRRSHWTIRSRATCRRFIFWARGLRTCASPAIRSLSTASRSYFLGPKPEKDAPYTKGAGFLDRVTSQHEEVRKHKNLIDELCGAILAFRGATRTRRRWNALWSARRVGGAHFPGQCFGHVIHVPDFGTDILGHLRLEQSDYNRQGHSPEDPGAPHHDRAQDGLRRGGRLGGETSRRTEQRCLVQSARRTSTVRGPHGGFLRPRPEAGFDHAARSSFFPTDTGCIAPASASFVPLKDTRPVTHRLLRPCPAAFSARLSGSSQQDCRARLRAIPALEPGVGRAVSDARSRGDGMARYVRGACGCLPLHRLCAVKREEIHRLTSMP